MRDEQEFRAGPGAEKGTGTSNPEGADSAAQARAMVGAVGQSILANGDVARAQIRRREVRLRRVLVVLCVVLGWMVLRLIMGRGLFPSLFSIPPSMDRFIPAFVIIVLLAAVMIGPMLGAGRSPHILIRPGETEVGLDDVVGIDGIKAEVVRSVNLFLAHQTFRSSMGGSARRGVLFEGPPGTGKTFVAKAMAKEAQVPFLFVSASAFQSMYFGQTNRKIRTFFKRLRKYARTEGGAIGFIEEIDAIGGSRRGQGGGGEGVTGVVNELLVQLQSFDSPSRSRRVRNAWIDAINRYLPAGKRLRKPAVVPANVLIVGATNRKDDLDAALLRPGRFDRSIYFGLPGRGARADIVAYYLGKKAHDVDLDAHDAVDRVAGMTSGYSPAALERLLDEALVIALTHGRTAMSISDVAEAKMLVELGVTDPAIYTDEDRVRVATHEAGHATVAYFLGRSRQMDVLSIVKRRDSLGLLQHSDTEERFTQRRDEMDALLQISMGGLVAEYNWFDEVSTGPAGDLAAATNLGAQMIGACGMGESLISIAAAGNGLLSGGLVEKVLADKEARAELDALLASSRDAAHQIVTEHPAVVEALRDALLERDELVGDEITDVITGCLQELAERR